MEVLPWSYCHTIRGVAIACSTGQSREVAGSGQRHLNSGQNRVLALDAGGTIVRDTGPIEDLNPGGGISARMAAIMSACAARGQSRHFRGPLTRPASIFSRREGSAKFRRPRGLRFGPDNNLYCVAQDEVVAFDFANGDCLGSTVQFPRLYGQAIVSYPSKSK
jgi:hypothetical protein